MQQAILSFKNRAEVLELPVPLQEWSLDSPQNTYTFNTLETGDILALGAEQLKSIAITSFFPSQKYSFLYTKNIKDPWECVNMINRWKNSKEPIRLTIVGTNINLNMGISKFSYDKMDGTKDVGFTLELLEYPNLNVQRYKDGTQKYSEKSKLKPRANTTKNQARSHMVKKGDTMWDMAEKYLGNGRRWREIAKANGMKSGWDLRVGKSIKIPKK